MEHSFIIHSEKDVERVASEAVPFLKEHKVVAFYGDMGVGKTTFIKGVCKVLGVEDPVTSPSFAIVNEYEGNDNQVIFHFDFYRLKDVSEVFDMGYEDYFFSDHICLIEWPEKIASVLPDDRLDAYLSENEDGSRNLKIKSAV
ncbi:tRNA (adenosine(37)-N6)-threonylcarbamoyltransferase complex ATPase subunit type 1 TsaE [Marinilabilia rubra]|uniref:tRNA threonylcarbamoyladenosine biosynthesis protein TsaE n=1 Tax=Marinilabilia rubra TaxID=2162893 RepID=A0A2U2B7Y8_9BACT|nr:tRNA (adenosine(37)-N6)-threonylcarbamoyltransferase complex ATPase subunit type 1 TsaE [Marinilabilia rubra]PWD99180.1 tRNA (adenosine(37)-N6)-threonylcarbamoyltransferase complex ATPase subunit type 1 TsaE [Marinilabilia rubra]